MGIWYGVEKIDHMEERHYRAQSSSCPIIHISEDRPPPTVNPLYRHYNYTHVYGTGQGYGTPLPSVGRYQPEQHQTYTGRDRQTTYSNYPEERRHRGLNAPNNPEMRYLRLYWVESGDASIEFHLRYNISNAGFWISSGPVVGMPLDDKYSHFAGTVQVLKAVGSHLVLNFCHLIPERQLFTIILAREVRLKTTELNGVHSMLHRKGLNTNSVKKMCNNSGNSISSTNLSLVLVLAFIWRSVVANLSTSKV